MAITGGRLLTSWQAAEGVTTVTSAAVSASANALIAVCVIGKAWTATTMTFSVSNSGTALTWTKVKEANLYGYETHQARASIWLADAPSGLSSRTITATMTTNGLVDYYGPIGGVALLPYAFYGAKTASTAVGDSIAGTSSTNNLTTSAIPDVDSSSVTLWAGGEGGRFGDPTSSTLTTATATTTGGSTGLAGITGTQTGTGAMTCNLNAYLTDPASWSYCGVELLDATPPATGGTHRFLSFF